MPRLRILAPIALLVAVLVARRRRRAPAPPLRTRVVAPALPAAQPRFVSVPWTLVEAPADRPELSVGFERDDSMELDRVDVQETPTQVFATVLVRWQPSEGSRFSPATTEEATAQLARPLGERELIHAPTDLDRPVDPSL
jgi:hypothetical protein